MSRILPAGQHFGSIVQRWSSDQMMLCRVVYDGKTISPLHGNEQASLIFVETGHCVKQIGSRSVELAGSSGLFIPPERLQKDTFSCATTFLAAEFSTEFASRLYDSGLRSGDLMSFTAAETGQLRARMWAELLNPDSLTGVVLEGAILSTMALAQRRLLGRSGHPPLWLKRARDLLRERITEVVTIEEIARLVRIHPAHLSREFKRWFHCTPGEYLRDQRLQLAKVRLEETDATLLRSLPKPALLIRRTSQRCSAHKWDARLRNIAAIRGFRMCVE